jgi:hypothetical protein
MYSQPGAQATEPPCHLLQKSLKPLRGTGDSFVNTENHTPMSIPIHGLKLKGKIKGKKNQQTISIFYVIPRHHAIPLIQCPRTQLDGALYRQSKEC